MKNKEQKKIGNRRNDISTEEIIKLYFEGNKSPREIGKILNCSEGLVRERIKKEGLPMRNNSEVERKNIFLKGHKTWNTGLTKITNEKVKKFSEEKIKWWQENKFNSKGNNILKNLVNRTGELNSSWINGKSFEPYGLEFNRYLKEEIRKRDNYTCQECNKTQLDYNFKLHIHHINYNKKDNVPLNLISLCNKCHSKTNFNRQHWEKYFKLKMFFKEFFNPQNIKIFNENNKLIAMERI